MAHTTNTILLRGEINRTQMNRFRRELARIDQDKENHGPITLVIDSLGGDTTQEALETVTELEKYGERLQAKIYKAGSLAVLIALVAPHREIVEEGCFWIHLGNVKNIEGCEIIDGRIPRKVDELLKKFRGTTLHHLSSVESALRASGKWDRLLASNKLELTPAECLQFGLVNNVI